MPRLFGIVNLTEDSFSDGGLYLEPAAAIAHAKALAASGADVIDLGPASSHPDSSDVDAREEIRRLEPVVEALHENGLELSIDSYRSETQRWAIRRGVAWLNDIQGFTDESFHAELAAAPCKLVVMHSIQRSGGATREATEPQSVLDGLLRFLEARVSSLTAAGVAPERIAIDPGMGFFLGNQPEVSLHVLRNLDVIRARLGRSLLVSVSRKSFLGALTGRPHTLRGAATLAAELYAADHGADFIRTHDVAALSDALRVASALRGSISSDPPVADRLTD